MVEGARLEYECAVHPAPRVRIPPSPQLELSLSLGRSSAIEFALRVGSNANSISHCVGIRKAQAVYDFAERSGAKLSPSPGREFLASDSELRNSTPNPSLSASRKYLYFYKRKGFVYSSLLCCQHRGVWYTNPIIIKVYYLCYGATFNRKT